MASWHIKQSTDERQPWVTCFLTNILLSYIQETTKGKKVIDYPALFTTFKKGFRALADPEAYLKDVNNWVPLSVHRDLLWQCETISGRKDFAYHAARAYFDPKKKQLPSLFEIIAHLLNDIRSLLLCADLWAAVQTNYLKFQAFDSPGRDLHMLAQFESSARPTVGSMHFLRGMCEGFIRLCSFINDVTCSEEVSQLQIDDVIREFPGFETFSEGNHVSIYRHGSRQSLIEAIKIPLKTEIVNLSPEFVGAVPDAVVVHPKERRIHVLTNSEETEPLRRTDAPSGYKIVKGGVLSHGTLLYSFTEGQIFNAPYSRFRFAWTERATQNRTSSSEYVSRRGVSQLLFNHLKQIKRTDMHMIEDNIENNQLTLQNIRLRREIKREYNFPGIVGQSEGIRQILTILPRVAQTDSTVIITGESGTGKELIARAIHGASGRAQGPFVSVSCATFPEHLLENELFGHVKGAFTGALAARKGLFEEAHGGTFFLDEIGEAPLPIQTKLLRVLEERSIRRLGDNRPIAVDVRILAATNRDLATAVQDKVFREDLFYRLNVIRIHLPSLRERMEDVPLLARHFLALHGQRLQRDLDGFSPAALEILTAYPFPGNVRELSNAVEQAVALAAGPRIEPHDMPEKLRHPEAAAVSPAGPKSLAAVERDQILERLQARGGNLGLVAKDLGISRTTLWRRMKEYKIET